VARKHRTQIYVCGIERRAVWVEVLARPGFVPGPQLRAPIMHQFPIRALLAHALARRDRAVIADPDRGCLERFCR
jgi:hypothetical protein